jgi:radical SAM superfamily enzyme YgiQ (UPF0313 family)
MKKRVALFEFPVFSRGFPLASGYLEAFARTNPAVDSAFEFQKLTIPLKSPQIAHLVDEMDADVYAFSCYVWNMGLVRRILPTLLAHRPEALVVLGGPQVMNKGTRYLSAESEQLVLVNGEGERTFAELLARRAIGDDDFSSVKGLSYYRQGRLMVTPPQARIEDLDDIPSPYLEGYFDAAQYVWAPLETNRGCPFQCTYCYWGAATNARIHKFDGNRVFAELEWLSLNRVLYVVITDANFGVLPRDLAIAEHLANCRREYGFPLTVAFSSSKNTPQRVSEITRTFEGAGLIATQPISLQTMSEAALSSVKRRNIRSSSYIDLQRVLNDSSTSSFIEIIWPLPGETLQSYKEGIGRLCSQGADSFTIYPLLLINNVELDAQRGQHGLRTLRDPDPDSEAEIVVSTRSVAYEEFLEGLRFACHVTSLYSLRGLRFVAQHLDRAGSMSYADLFSEFSRACATMPEHPYTRFVQTTIDALDQDSSGLLLNSEGAVVHLVLHAARQAFDLLLVDFVEHHCGSMTADLRFLLELDLLNRPHAYSNTDTVDTPVTFEVIRILRIDDGACVVEIPARYRQTAACLLGRADIADASRVRINYRTTQLPFMPGKQPKENYAYCQDRLRRARSLLPVWRGEA